MELFRIHILMTFDITNLSIFLFPWTFRFPWITIMWIVIYLILQFIDSYQIILLPATYFPRKFANKL